MAPVCVLRTSGIILLLYLTISIASPWFSINVNKYSCDESKCDYNLRIDGEYDLWSITSVPGVCTSLQHINPIGKDVEIQVGGSEKLYFCAKSGDGPWYEQDYYLNGNDVISREQR